MASDTNLTSAEVLLPAPNLDANVEFFVDQLGFQLQLIYPADNPAVAVVEGAGLRLRLDVNHQGPAGVIRMQSTTERADAVAPNGTEIQFVSAPGFTLPALAQSLVITPMLADHEWITGRAGMQYRDLLPDREGGRFIVSHIRIPTGGPVPDYVHFHQIRFQMIYCHKGWVRVVYEDQGESFVMHPGDCVLQPPEIRHRVLECSDGLEVIEVGCPAEHLTRVEHNLELPNPELQPERDFGGQRFVRHVASDAAWETWDLAHFSAQDLGIYAATDGLARVRVVRCDDAASAGAQNHHHRGELFFLFVLRGAVTLVVDGLSEALSEGAAFAIPAGQFFSLTPRSDDLQLLEVALPNAA